MFRSKKMMRPTFNVTEFQEVIHVQMNRSMRSLIVELIEDCEGDNLEPELRALRRALVDPHGAQIRRATSQSRNFDQRFRGDGYKSDRAENTDRSRTRDVVYSEREER
jgi:hypothetical protein